METTVLYEYDELTLNDKFNEKWLEEINDKRQDNMPPLFSYINSSQIKLGSYVGVLESPTGDIFEILPKTQKEQDANKAREILLSMLHVIYDLPFIDVGLINRLSEINAPVIIEYVISQFLTELDLLLKRGLSLNYLQIYEERNFIRGKINMSKQLRQPPHRQHLVHLCHNLFQIDRPENRLIKTALQKCFQVVRVAKNWERASIFTQMLSEISLTPQKDILKDLHNWSRDRHMLHYEKIRPWCRLILESELPVSVYGEKKGISLLFQMEALFEKFVAKYLKQKLKNNLSLHEQSVHPLDEQDLFQIRPDIVIKENSETLTILDTKWKLLDETHKEWHYNILQEDIYQVLTYAYRYLDSHDTEVALIYPRTEKFNGQIAPIRIEPNSKNGTITVYILAFNLDPDEQGLIRTESNQKFLEKFFPEHLINLESGETGNRSS